MEKKETTIEVDHVENNTYINLLEEVEYLKSTLAASISRIGDGIDTIAFSLLVFHLTGSQVLVATIFGVNCLLNIIFGMFSGVLCSYVSKKRIAVICDIGRFTCVTYIGLRFITGTLTVTDLFIVTFINSSFESFRAPANTSLTPLLLQRKNYERGISLNASVIQWCELIGLALAPIVIGIMGLGGALVLDGLTFLGSAFIMTTLKYKENLKSEKKISSVDYFNEIKEGFIYIKKDKLILTLCVFGGLINGLLVPYDAFQAVFVEGTLNLGSEGLVMLSAPMIITMAIVGMFIPRLKEKFNGKNIFIFGGFLVAFAYELLSMVSMINFIPQYIILIIISIILGLGIVLLNVPMQITMYKMVNEEYLSRVSATFNAILLCAMPLVSFFLSIISTKLSLEVIYVLFGIIIFIIFSTQIFNKSLRGLND